MEELQKIWHNLKVILEFELISVGGYHLSIYNILMVVFIFLLIKILLRLLEKFIKRNASEKEWISDSKQHAIIQIGKYIIYILGFLFAMRSIGVNITPILLSSSALFIGLGFGLQEAFRDFISGLILLFEGDVVIGDVIEFENGLVAVVKQIKLRTSKVRTRDGIVMFIPNSQLTNNRVINWSNSSKLTRFHISVGVAYGSDVRLVEKLLLEVATEEETVSNRVKSFVRFADFGESSLDFELNFWSENVWQIELVKSRMRFNIDQKFRDNHINIPFPQRDLHIKSSNVPLK